MEYKKPQSTIIQGNVGIYPLTTADQVILADGTRLEKDGKINVDVANSADSAKLGGKAPEYYIQPRNLLDNSDFRNPVNQRGKTDYTSNGYTIDRWELYSGAVGVSSLGYITTSGQMYQKIAIPTDKVYTFAIENDAGIALVTGIPANGIHSATLGNALIKLATIDEYAEVVIEPSEGHNLAGAYWAALYEGSYTADTLPPYVPKGYAAELAECKKQVAVFGRDSGDEKFVAGYGSIISTTSANIYIPYPTKMRVNPTISDTSGSNWILRSNGKTYTPKSISPWFSSEYVIGIRVAGAFSSEDVGKTAILNSDTSTKVVFSSEM